jgi:oligo-1,6-glucosidase
VHENHTTVNVANQQNDHNSVLNHFRKMVALRKKNLLLVYGNYEIIQEEHPTIYAYSRTLEDQKMLILLNFSELESSIAMSSYNSANEVLINNYSELSVDKNTITLKPYQAVVLKL